MKTWNCLFLVINICVTNLVNSLIYLNMYYFIQDLVDDFK